MASIFDIGGIQPQINNPGFQIQVPLLQATTAGAGSLSDILSKNASTQSTRESTEKQALENQKQQLFLSNLQGLSPDKQSELLLPPDHLRAITERRAQDRKFQLQDELAQASESYDYTKPETVARYNAALSKVNEVEGAKHQANLDEAKSRDEVISLMGYRNLAANGKINEIIEDVRAKKGDKHAEMLKQQLTGDPNTDTKFFATALSTIKGGSKALENYTNNQKTEAETLDKTATAEQTQTKNYVENIVPAVQGAALSAIAVGQTGANQIASSISKLPKNSPLRPVMEEFHKMLQDPKLNIQQRVEAIQNINRYAQSKLELDKATASEKVAEAQNKLEDYQFHAATPTDSARVSYRGADGKRINVTLTDSSPTGTVTPDGKIIMPIRDANTGKVIGTKVFGADFGQGRDGQNAYLALKEIGLEKIDVSKGGGGFNAIYKGADGKPSKVDHITDLIGKSSNGGVQELVGKGVGFLGATTESREADQQLQVYASKLRTAVAGTYGANPSDAEGTSLMNSIGIIDSLTASRAQKLAAWNTARTSLEVLAASREVQNIIQSQQQRPQNAIPQNNQSGQRQVIPVQTGTAQQQQQKPQVKIVQEKIINGKRVGLGDDGNAYEL